MENYKLITDKKEVEKLLDNFFRTQLNYRLIEALTHLSKGNGCSEEYHSIDFKHELDEYDLSMLHQPMKDRHILVSAFYPVVEEDCAAYISFEEFYEYLEKVIHQVLKKGVPKGFQIFDEIEILRLLRKTKVALGLLSQQEYENEYGVEPEFLIVTDEKEIDLIFYGFFATFPHNELISLLDKLSKRQEVKEKERTFQFLDTDDESQLKSSNVKQVLLTVDYPIVLKTCKIYLNYEEFYLYLEKAINTAMKTVFFNSEWKWNESEIREELKK